MRTEIYRGTDEQLKSMLLFHDPSVADIPEMLEIITAHFGEAFSANDILHSISNPYYKVNIQKNGINMYHSCGCCNPFIIQIYKGQRFQL